MKNQKKADSLAAEGANEGRPKIDAVADIVMGTAIIISLVLLPFSASRDERR